MQMQLWQQEANIQALLLPTLLGTEVTYVAIRLRFICTSEAYFEDFGLFQISVTFS
jgi:hypothetical protein